MDQAQKLREIVRKTLNLQEQVPADDARIIAVSSGKGGVGKTNFTVNLGLALANMGKSVTVIDADLGLANVDVVMGLMPKYNLSDFLSGRNSVQEIVEEGPLGLRIISGGSGIADLANIDELQLEKLILSLSYFNSISDYILIDTAAGLGMTVLSFVASASELIVVITPDPTSITDAYALIKNVIADTENKVIKLVINRVESNEEGDRVYNKLSQATQRFLNKDLENLGYIFEDANVKRAVRKQTPLFTTYPRSLATKGIEHIAFNIEHNNQYLKSENSFKSFLHRLIKKI